MWVDIIIAYTRYYSDFSREGVHHLGEHHCIQVEYLARCTWVCSVDIVSAFTLQ
jgi:hypothetical protein